ncbi:hypothetical protein PF010_g31287 [Phytophthora fragariae]|uniref:Uncharacterized protein n=1 Tax=Phytophthora fragariae TaxID=53985 RepID=A0A6G0JHY7_9STRA|nr:hypothetical protein PF010_g31287 [Phytophthora fragariae]
MRLRSLACKCLTATDKREFIILVESGFTPFQAILFNFLSALSAFLGATMVLAAAPVTNKTMGLLLAVGSVRRYFSPLLLS